MKITCLEEGIRVTVDVVEVEHFRLYGEMWSVHEVYDRLGNRRGYKVSHVGTGYGVFGNLYAADTPDEARKDAKSHLKKMGRERVLAAVITAILRQRGLYDQPG